MKDSLLYLLLPGLLMFNTAMAQQGDNAVFGFLNLPSSARMTALGGSVISVHDGDLGLSLYNPALLNADMDQNLAVNQQFLFDGINTGNAAIAFQSKKLGATIQAGLQYISYGDFDLTDEQGNILGEFRARELALILGSVYHVNERFAVGGNLKVISSSLERYNAYGLAVDIAGIYHDPENQLTVAVVLSNAGMQLKSYTGDNPEPLPVNLQLGISKRLKHLPFRFTVTAHSLQQWDLLYDSPLDDEEVSQLFGEEPAEQSAFAREVDNFFMHLIFSGEFLLGKSENLRLRIGYNHQRKKELSVNSLRSLAGFSAGVGIKVNKFFIDYGFGKYHIAGSSQHVSISTNLGEFGNTGMLH